MKNTIQLIAVLAGWLTSLIVLQAQGTMQFTVNLNGANEVPPNNSLAVADGTFSLDGSTLSYTVGMRTQNTGFLPTSAGLYGPANPSANANLIFDLGNYDIILNPLPGGYVLAYGGAFTLTQQQISDLSAGLWYVNFTSSDYPSGEIRGQVVSVPEPSALALIGLGLATLLWGYRRQT